MSKPEESDFGVGFKGIYIRNKQKDNFLILQFQLWYNFDY